MGVVVVIVVGIVIAIGIGIVMVAVVAITLGMAKSDSESKQLQEQGCGWTCDIRASFGSVRLEGTVSSCRGVRSTGGRLGGAAGALLGFGSHSTADIKWLGVVALSAWCEHGLDEPKSMSMAPELNRCIPNCKLTSWTQAAHPCPYP